MMNALPGIATDGHFENLIVFVAGSLCHWLTITLILLVFLMFTFHLVRSTGHHCANTNYRMMNQLPAIALYGVRWSCGNVLLITSDNALPQTHGNALVYQEFLNEGNWNFIRWGDTPQGILGVVGGKESFTAPSQNGGLVS